MTTIYIDASQFDPHIKGWGRSTYNTATKEKATPRYFDIKKRRSSDGIDFYQLMVTSEKVDFAVATRDLRRLTEHSPTYVKLFKLQCEKEQCVFEKCTKSNLYDRSESRLAQIYLDLWDINEKVINKRFSSNPPVRFLRSLFHQLPVGIFPHTVKFCHLIQKDTCCNFEMSKWIPYTYRTETTLPLCSEQVEDLSTEVVRPTLGKEYRFSSLKGRAICLKDAGKNLLKAVVSPLMVPVKAVKGCSRWRDKAWGVVDTLYTMAALPIFYVIAAIKLIAAAIFHPGLVYRPLSV